MAAMVTGTKPVIKKGSSGGPKLPGPNGNGSKRNGGNFLEPESHSSRYRIGMWVALASIGMLFTALSSAYIVRAASADDWVPLTMPRALLLSTVFILASSGTLESARRKLKGSLAAQHKQWLLITVVLGLGFLTSQLVAWKQLARQGVYLSSNPHSSFFYLLTAMHALHLLGGLLALTYLLIRSRRFTAQSVVSARHLGVTDAVTIYWHFMDVLWVYLFLLLFLWR